MYLENLRKPILNIKVEREGHMGFLCVLRVHDILLEACSWPGFTKCHSVDGATLLLPAEATTATRGQYLALTKA